MRVLSNEATVRELHTLLSKNGRRSGSRSGQ
jgi:hypothetical protein